MRGRSRPIISVTVLASLAAFVLLARWYNLQRATPALTGASRTLDVTSGADRGAGSLREAVFAADTAGTGASIVIRVSRITLASALPPIVNPHGIRIATAGAAVQIDARAVGAGTPVFDIDAEQAALSGLSIRGCPGAAILVRAARFRLSDSSIQSCDLGVEVAANATGMVLERNRLQANRIGVRFSGASRGSELVKNVFIGNADAGVWLVASQPQPDAAPINVQDNQFSANGTGVVQANVPTVVEHNDFSSVRAAAVHLIGAGAIVRDNHVSGGKAAGIIAEDASGAVIEDNELDHLDGYAVLVRGSAGTVLQGNRIESCAYGMGFVLGDEHRPNTVVGNVLIALKYDGIDVIGGSPVLRRNRVLQARVVALHTENFSDSNGKVVRARPLLEGNDFQLGSNAAFATADRR